jgi:hypothetical protein
MKTVSEPKIKSYLIHTDGYGDGIIFSTTRARAFWTAVKSYCESFSATPRTAFQNMRIYRFERYDNKASQYKSNFLYGEDAIE